MLQSTRGRDDGVYEWIDMDSEDQEAAGAHTTTLISRQFIRMFFHFQSLLLIFYAFNHFSMTHACIRVCMCDTAQAAMSNDESLSTDEASHLSTTTPTPTTHTHTYTQEVRFTAHVWNMCSDVASSDGHHDAREHGGQLQGRPHALRDAHRRLANDAQHLQLLQLVAEQPNV